MPKKQSAPRDTHLRTALKWVERNPGVYELLGVVSDQEISERLRCNKNRVARYRRALGINLRRGRRPDSGKNEIVENKRQHTLSPPQIHSMVTSLEKEVHLQLTERYKDKYPGIFDVLGTKSDQRVGDVYGVTRETIRLIRNKFKIQTQAASSAIRSEFQKPSLPIDKEIALSLICLSRFISNNIDLICEVAYGTEEEE